MTDEVATQDLFNGDDFIMVGQKMVDAEGVTVLVGEVVKVEMREVVSFRHGETVDLWIKIKPGYMKVRADTFLAAMEAIANP